MGAVTLQTRSSDRVCQAGAHDPPLSAQPPLLLRFALGRQEPPSKNARRLGPALRAAAAIGGLVWGSHCRAPPWDRAETTLPPKPHLCLAAAPALSCLPHPL